LRNNKFTAGTVLALVIALAGAVNARPSFGAIFIAQETKPAQSSDKRADALKKYLEAQRLEQAGNYPGAVAAYKEALTYAQRLVALEPLLEVHQRTYMRLLALNGERTAALAQYKRLRATLNQELAIEPEEALSRLLSLVECQLSHLVSEVARTLAPATPVA